jgi:putative tryptophan/tyrosine transport system substrate-binding protein
MGGLGAGVAGIPNIPQVTPLRREFIAGLGSAAAWPVAARAQQGGPGRRIGILTRGHEAEPVTQTQLGVLREWLAKFGWIEGRNARFDLRFIANNSNLLRTHADELVRLAPEVITVESLPAAQALLQRTRTIPIVFISVGDPIAGGLLKDIARPEGNITGTTTLFQSIGGKWLELLKDAAPRTNRVALIFDAEYVAAVDLLKRRSMRRIIARRMKAATVVA